MRQIWSQLGSLLLQHRHRRATFVARLSGGRTTSGEMPRVSSGGADEATGFGCTQRCGALTSASREAAFVLWGHVEGLAPPGPPACCCPGTPLLLLLLLLLVVLVLPSFAQPSSSVKAYWANLWCSATGSERQWALTTCWWDRVKGATGRKSWGRDRGNRMTREALLRSRVFCSVWA